MESPNKRLKRSPPAFEADEDYIALGGDDEDDKAAQYGYETANASFEHDKHNFSGPSGAPRAKSERENQGFRSRNARGGPRNAKDRPKSKHALPGYAPWILVRTKFGRRFAHNTETKESFWYIPRHVMPGVLDFEQSERDAKEKAANAKWAEEQLQEMRANGKAAKVDKAANEDPRNRRRRSESLQREDEEAMMAELAAEAQRAEEQDVKEVVKKLEPLKPITEQGGVGYDSESSYEEVEVTDSEFEDDEEHPPQRDAAQEQRQDDGPVEFGEDDIAYQLAAMGEDYGLEPDEYRDEGEEDWDEGADDLGLTEEDAANLFRDMLDDHKISPFTPWDKLIADESESGIIMDDRYTVLPNTRTRKEIWEAWVKDTAARLKEERMQMEKLDPKIPYLAFLSQNATPKLYWPEFKRKYKKEGEMNDRKLSDKDREKLYRDHINRLKLPENTRKADLITLLKSMPLRTLNKSSSVEALPQQLLSHLHFISLSSTVRGPMIVQHISSLPPASTTNEDGELTAEQRAEEDKRREERRRRENALAERERKVDEQRRKAEKEERMAKRDLQDEERELRKALDVQNRGLKAQWREDV